jgi:hypothetical protein
MKLFPIFLAINTTFAFEFLQAKTDDAMVDSPTKQRCWNDSFVPTITFDELLKW